MTGTCSFKETLKWLKTLKLIEGITSLPRRGRSRELLRATTSGTPIVRKLSSRGMKG
jgi:hypothetical protein